MSKINKRFRGFRAEMAVCGFLLALCAAPSQAQVFSQPMDISGATRNSVYPDIVVDAQGDINVAWISTSGINFARSTNGGVSFLPTITVGAVSVGATFQPQMIVDATGTIIEIAWAKRSTAAGAPAGTYDVFASRSIDGGLTFPTTTKVSATPAVLVDSPRLAFDGVGVDVVWGNQATWISQSATGVTFAAPITLSIAAQDSGGPRIAVDKSGNVFVAWTDRLAEDQNQQGNYCTQPAGTTNGNGIITTYTNTFGGNYYLNEKLAAAPRPSSASTRNLSNSWKDSSYPSGYFGCSFDSLQLFFDQNDNLHLLWADEAPIEDLLTSTAIPPASGSGLPTFTFPIGLVADEGVGTANVTTDANGSIYAVYASGPKAPSSTEGIYFNRSDNDGASFAFPESSVISAPGAISPAYPQIAVDSNSNVNVVWEQADQPITAGGTNTFHLFFTRSQDRGDTFPTIRPVPMTSSVLCIPATPAGTATPTTPDTTTCGTVQMGVDGSSNGDMAWVNDSGSATNIDFAVANVAAQPANDFTISVNSATPTAYSGQAVTFNVSAQAIGSFNSPITMGCNDFPEIATAQGGTVRRSDFSCSASGALKAANSVIVTLAIPPELPAGSYNFAINGTSGGTTHRVMATFTTAGPAGSVQPNSATLAVGASANFNVNINSGVFAGTVNFQCNGQPAWIQCAFNPSSINAAAQTSSVMKVTVLSAPTASMLSDPPAVRGLPTQRHEGLWGALLAALCLMAVAMISVGRREKLSAALLRGFAVMALTMVLAAGLVSCGGAASPGAGSNNAGGTGGTSGGAGGNVTATFMVQAQAGNGITNLGTVSITTQ